MIGSRREDAAHYPVNETAAKYDASAATETDDPVEAYADWRREELGAGPEPLAAGLSPSVGRILLVAPSVRC